jgi:type I restriction enzyme, S subunit
MEIETIKNNSGVKWEMVKLGDLTEPGFMFDGDWIESKDQDPLGEIRLIQLADIGDGYFIDKSNRFINRETSIKLRCTFLKKNDILIARMPDPLGRACLFPFEEEDSYVTVVDVCVMRIKKGIDQKYVTYAINSPDFRQKLDSQITGTTRLRISGKKLKDLQIPLPPLSVQKRIAEILDAADALRRKDQELLKKYDELAQAIFIDMFGDPVKNEKGWEVKTLKDCTTKIGSGATPTGGKTAYKSTGISLIRSMNVYDFSFKWKDLAFIDNEQAAKLNNVEVMSKDVLFNITGASVCRCSIVPEQLLPARVNQHVAIIRAKTEILNPIFLNHLLVSNSVKNKLLGVGSGGGAVMEAITKEQLEQFKITVPPVELQNNFERIINNNFKQKDIEIKSIDTSESLFQTLLQKAFKGELVAE